MDTSDNRPSTFPGINNDALLKLGGQLLIGAFKAVDRAALWVEQHQDEIKGALNSVATSVVKSLAESRAFAAAARLPATPSRDRP